VTFGRLEILDAFKEARVVMRADFRIAKLADMADFHLAAELLRHQLHAIADAKHRHTQVEHDLRRARRASIGDGVRATRQDDAFRRELTDEGFVDVVRMDLRINVRFANAARDQLGDLRTEIEDQDLVVRGGVLRGFVLHGSGQRRVNEYDNWTQMPGTDVPFTLRRKTSGQRPRPAAKTDSTIQVRPPEAS
jgi:hypothetical protein